MTTWGIAGRDFLWLYAALCAAGYGAVKFAWLKALGPKPPSPDTRSLDLYETAIVNGGHQLAITTAATKLHRDGALMQGPGVAGSLIVAGDLAPGAHPLERAVHDAAGRTPNISSWQLRRELDDSAAIDAMLTELTDEGLLVDEPAYAAHRRLWPLGAALVALGVARLAAVWGHDTDVGLLVALVIAAAFVTIGVLRRQPIATQRGRALVQARRDSREDLRERAPIADSALAVALFGGAALWIADPAIAALLEVPREEAQLFGSRNESCSGGGGGGCAGGMSDGGCGGCGGCGCGG